MRGQQPMDQQPLRPLEMRRDRAPHGAGVVLAVTAGTLCWAGLIALFL